MKKFKLLLTTLILLFIGSTVVEAQSAKFPWAISIGGHATDHKAARPFGDKFFKTGNWSVTPPLSKLSIIRNLNPSFNLDLTASVGEIDNKRLGIEDEFMVNVGLGLRYQFANGYLLNENSWFDPYIRVGAGYHMYDYKDLEFPLVTPDGDRLSKKVSTAKDHFALVGGLGINFWVSRNFGFNIATDYNWIPSASADYFDFFQHSFGVTFRFADTDRDDDGIPNKEDACPDVAGVASDDPECHGCPDTDGDGICDAKDECPEEAGVPELNGCPILDRDGDGINDDVDACPDTPGVASDDPECHGCPDTDGDGICDAKDECPNEAGLAEFGGCPEPEPEVIITVEDSRKLKDALQSVLFEYNSDKLTASSQGVMKEVAAILNSSKSARSTHWVIEGHTDNVGSQNYNLPLSQKRAESVQAFLEKEGVAKGRLKSVGFGRLMPITTNATEQGRARNRRVTIVYTDSNFSPAAIPTMDAAGAQSEIDHYAKYIYFETAKAALVETSKVSLQVIAAYMKLTGKSYEIQGHTDSVGKDSNNLALSQRRAQSVVDYLIAELGVPAEQLTAKGYGASQPKFDNKTADGRAQNRRIEIKQVK